MKLTKHRHKSVLTTDEAEGEKLNRLNAVERMALRQVNAQLLHDALLLKTNILKRLGIISSMRSWIRKREARRPLLKTGHEVQIRQVKLHPERKDERMV